jgi:hypothetical protein
MSKNPGSGLQRCGLRGSVPPGLAKQLDHLDEVAPAHRIRACRQLLSRISSAGSNSSAASLRGTIRPRGISSPRSTSPSLQSGFLTTGPSATHRDVRARNEAGPRQLRPNSTQPQTPPVWSDLEVGSTA